MNICVYSSLREIGRTDWDALAGEGFPFCEYDFLRALETSGSVGEGSGWHPIYLVAEDRGCIAGAMYLYAKEHSFGEYIFDWAWAEAFERYGLDYFPKLVSAVPFTPATGPKLLVRPGQEAARVREALVQAALQITVQHKLSSFHVLFIPPEEKPVYAGAEMWIRSSVQYHWHNREYSDFEAFLATLKVKKRHEIRRERKRVENLPVEIRLLTGDALSAEHARVMYGFYQDTYDRKRGSPYLTPEFFETIFDIMRERIVLWLAREEGEWTAGAIHFRKGPNLYGRYWGTRRPYRFLHFELCYYRAIEYAIEQGLQLVEAGAQGPHKMLRGFSPVTTYSAHWIADPDFRQAIGQFIAEEKSDIEAGVEQAEIRSAYRREGEDSGQRS
jgi:predicted N-acyltransferase